jgi:endonuclease/exonuclease/phosphatase family metal-dependent hydrolase
MTRILSYNILRGGTGRVDQLARIIGSTRADVVGLVEAINPRVVEELAQRLDMPFYVSGQTKGEKRQHLAVLSRLPILEAQIHMHPGIFTRRSILEVCIEGVLEKPLTLFVVHLTSRFHQGRESNRIRCREIQEILHIVAPKRGLPHVILGDFNSVAPGEPVKGSSILRYFLSLRQARRQKSTPFVPYAGRSIRRLLRRALFERAMQTIVRSKVLSTIVDLISPVYAQGGIDLLLKAGYVDCFRRANPCSPGFTCFAALPAGRIDFIFASPELAQRLSNSQVVTEGEGVNGAEASDHLAVYAEFEGTDILLDR